MGTKKHFYTSNFASHGDSPLAVRISLRSPTGYTGRELKKLASLYSFLKKYWTDHDSMAYTAEYDKILSNLNPHDIANELPDGAILLCYEKRDEFCHRHLVRNWLKQAGYDIEEISK